MKTFLHWVRGIDVPPALVGAARGVIEAAAFGAVGYAFIELSDVSNTYHWLWWAPMAPFVRRTLEGILDGIDPAKHRGG